MKARTVVVLMALFFGGLVALWWADRSGVPTAAERQRRAGRVLPELIDVPTADIRRVTIGCGSSRIELVRHGAREWIFGRSGPRGLVDAAKVETILTNLKALAPLPDSGPIPMDATLARQFGVSDSGLRVELHGKTSDAALASLAVGKTIGGVCYVMPDRPPGCGYAVDAKALAGLDGPAES